MLTNSTVLAALMILGIGCAGLWANPRRSVNRLFFTQSLHVAVWLGLLYLVFSSSEGLPWLRAASAVGAFFPLHFWLIKDTITAGAILPPSSRKGFAIGGLVSIGMAAICFTTLFVPPESTAERPVYGPAYYGYIVAIILAYIFLAVVTLRTIGRLQGLRRLELQLLLLGGCLTAIVVLVLMAVSARTGDPSWVRLAPIVTMVPYATTVWAITTARVFDARHLIMVSVHRGLLVAIVMVAGWALYQVFIELVPALLAYALSVGLVLWGAKSVDPWLQYVLDLESESSRNLRRATFEVARQESRLERLEQAFLRLLKGWAKTDNAILLFGEQGRLKGGSIDVPADCVPMRALRELRWATPERLARERSTPERARLLDFMHEHSLGVAASTGGPALAIVLGIGVRNSRRPFTYPEVTELIELATIIENALARAHFSVKAQHAEQLATVGLLGASLAHEIRNPLVSIKTFVQLLPHHYQDQAFRDKFFRLIGDEVQRIDRLTEQLLDLASPRAYIPALIPLHPVLEAAVELVAGKAAERSIRVISEFDANPDIAFTDPNAAKQVMLNLCFNAIQASEGRPGEHWVKVATRNVPDGLEFSVADSGPGLAPEVRARLFQPFQSTKSTGFGLGLAICRDIVSGLHATIAADPPAPGVGAVFRVVFPCQQPTS